MDVRPDQEIAQAKAALRRRFRAGRRALSPEAYAERSAMVVARAVALPELRAAQAVHVYWPLVERGEIDTRPLVRWLVGEGKEVVLPVVETFERAGRPSMRHVRYESEASLQANRWGVREPTGGETVPPERLGAVVVPALGAGRCGGRIGHGRGFYDAFLAGLVCRAVPRIGLVYADALVEAVPAEAHDVRLTVIVTERETVRL